MGRVLVLGLAMVALPGCLHAWAATFPTYYEVHFDKGAEQSDVLICKHAAGVKRGEAQLFCADAPKVLSEAGLRSDPPAGP